MKTLKNLQKLLALQTHKQMQIEMIYIMKVTEYGLHIKARRIIENQMTCLNSNIISKLQAMQLYFFKMFFLTLRTTSNITDGYGLSRLFEQRHIFLLTSWNFNQIRIFRNLELMIPKSINRTNQFNSPRKQAQIKVTNLDKTLLLSQIVTWAFTLYFVNRFRIFYDIVYKQFSYITLMLITIIIVLTVLS